MDIPFVDLAPQREALREEIDEAIAGVLDHGQFILGPEVEELEGALSAYMGGCEVVTCANGTDAITLALMALGIGHGDLVFCPSFTYVATAEAIVRAGATPFFVDIDRNTYTLCPEDLEIAIQHASENLGLRPAAIVAVDLFGQLADYRKIKPVADRYNLRLVADSAQALGARLGGRTAPFWADLATTSFYPTKPLGCYGDGGAIFTRDGSIAQRLRSLRFHGRSDDPALHVEIGMNSRLDTIQAAILNVKLRYLDKELERRASIAEAYTSALSSVGIKTPTLNSDEVGACIWSQYTIELDDPDGVATRLRQHGVGSARYYSEPIHTQAGYKKYEHRSKLPYTDQIILRVLSLPFPFREPPAIVTRSISAFSTLISD